MQDLEAYTSCMIWRRTLHVWFRCVHFIYDLEAYTSCMIWRRTLPFGQSFCIIKHESNMLTCQILIQWSKNKDIFYINGDILLNLTSWKGSSYNTRRAIQIGVVCTCLDIRSVNFVCFLKISILQLGMVEHLKVRHNWYRIENHYFKFIHKI